VSEQQRAAGQQAVVRSRRYRSWLNHLDRSLWWQLRQELHTVFRPPFEVIGIVLVNVALVLGMWFLLGPDTVARYSALIFLPVATTSWAYADVPATNLFGSHSDQVLAFLDDPAKIKRVITVQNLALWIVISPAMMIFSLALIPSQNEPMMSMAVAIGVLVVPFAYLGLASIMAPLLPFHPLPWRERLARRDTWLRYSLALGIAYLALTGPAFLLAGVPVWLLIHFFGGEPNIYLIGVVVAIPWCFLLWRAGLAVAVRLTMRRRAWLEDFLAHPERG